MFLVEILPTAKCLIAEKFAVSGFTHPVLSIGRMGSRADVVRLADGTVHWAIERPHPWVVTITEQPAVNPYPEGIVVVDGVDIFLALIPRAGELGLRISARDGQLFVDEIRL